MILQVLADLRKVDFRVDAQRGELLGGADARHHQQLRRADRAGAEDDLFVGMRTAHGAMLLVLDLRAPSVLQHQAPGERLGRDREVGPVDRRAQIRRSRALALAGEDQRVRDPHTERGLGIEIGHSRVAGPRRPLDEAARDRVGCGDLSRMQRAAAAAIPRVSVGDVFGSLEVRKDGLIVPAGSAAHGPTVEIRRMATDVHHVVDRSRPTEHLAPCRGIGPTEAGLHRRLEGPVGVAAEQSRPPFRRLDVRAPFVSAGFDEQHGDVRVLAEPGRHDTTRGPPAHDDVVKAFHDGRHVTSRAFV